MPFDPSTATAESSGFDPSSAMPEGKRSPKQMRSFGDIAKSTIGNIPSSAMGVVSGIGQVVEHPIDTVKNLWDIAAGGAQAALAPKGVDKSKESFLYSPSAAKSFEAAKEFYKQRYGGLSNIGHTLETDPVGALMDVSPAAGLLGKGAKLAGLSRTAVPLAKISELTDPVRQAARAAKVVAKPAYEYTAGLTTGAGAQAIKQALKGGDAFTQAMRGQISEKDVLDVARQAAQGLKDERGRIYRSRLAQLSQKPTFDIQSVMQDTDDWLKQYHITKTPSGKLDFSKSTLRANPTAASEVRSVYEAVRDFGSKQIPEKPAGLIVSEKGVPLTPGTPARTQATKLSAVQMDTLKRVINDSYSSTQPSRAMVRDLSNKVKNRLVKEVPEYATMTRDYAKASDLIDDISKGLGTSDKTATDTALRKLTSAMREDQTFRRGLIDKLDQSAGGDVASAVAGLLLKNPWTSRLGPIAHFYGTSAIAAYLHNPALLGLLPLASPRLVGEATMGLGKVGRALPSTVPLYQGAYQAGRIPGVDQPSPPLIPLSNVGQMRQQ